MAPWSAIDSWRDQLRHCKNVRSFQPSVLAQVHLFRGFYNSTCNTCFHTGPYEPSKASNYNVRRTAFASIRAFSIGTMGNTLSGSVIVIAIANTHTLDYATDSLYL